MALKTTKTRVPVSVTGVAKMMEMDTAEVRAWQHFAEVRTAINDYNLDYITKQRLISRLTDIATKNSADDLVHYSIGVENLATSIRLSY